MIFARGVTKKPVANFTSWLKRTKSQLVKVYLKDHLASWKHTINGILNLVFFLLLKFPRWNKLKMELPNYRFNYQNFYDFSHCIKNAWKLLNFPICPLIIISLTICLAENHQKDPHLSLVPLSYETRDRHFVTLAIKMHLHFTAHSSIYKI
jgi:hypothetical protein